MSVNIVEMSRVTGVKAERLEAVLGIRARVSCFEEACEVYRAHIGNSLVTKNITSVLLLAHTKTFQQALLAYSITTAGSPERDKILKRGLSLVSTPEEVGELCETVRSFPSDEELVLKNVTHFF